MIRENIPTSYKQVVLIFLLILSPILFSAYILLSPIAGAVGSNEKMVGYGLLVLSGILSLSICGSMLARRSLTVSGTVLKVMHSFYSIELNRQKLSNLRLAEKLEPISSHISTKRNGVAAFGFYSGWFNGAFGKVVFCAVSQKPVYLLEFDGHEKVSAILISCTPEGFHALSSWVNQKEN